ncbi:MAG TPA: hypothetical protein VMW48_00490 [Vicinamibacterales bacterium]|nr:hypothetical protein [Vicinamibacterales bacterium]
MAESNAWVGVQDVTVTRDSDSDEVAFTPVTDDSIELETTVEDLVLKSAAGMYDQTVITTHISYQATLNSKELDLADEVAAWGVGESVTVAWTLIAKGGASVNRTYSLAAKLMNEPSPGGTDGMSATQVQLVFRGVSTDGTTSPLTRPA